MKKTVIQIFLLMSAALVLGGLYNAGLLVVVGYAAVIIGFIMNLVTAFKQDVIKGFLSLFVVFPFYMFYFVFKNWDECKKGFLVLVGGGVLIFGGLAASSADTHLALSVPDGRYTNALNCPKPSEANEKPPLVVPEEAGSPEEAPPAPGTPDPVKSPVSEPAGTPPSSPPEEKTPEPAAGEEKTPRILIAEAFEEWEVGTLFIDARRTKNYVLGHIPGAISISPWENGREAKVARLAGEEPQAAPVVIYCTRSKDCEDSEMIASDLKKFEFSNIMVFQGGFPVWQEQEKPIAEGEEPGERPGQ